MKFHNSTQTYILVSNNRLSFRSMTIMNPTFDRFIYIHFVFGWEIIPLGKCVDSDLITMKYSRILFKVPLAFLKLFNKICYYK